MWVRNSTLPMIVIFMYILDDVIGLAMLTCSYWYVVFQTLVHLSTDPVPSHDQLDHNTSATNTTQMVSETHDHSDFSSLSQATSDPQSDNGFYAHTVSPSLLMHCFYSCSLQTSPCTQL